MILAINPGSMSTKIALYNQEECFFKRTIVHDSSDLDQFKHYRDQLPYRLDLVNKALAEINFAGPIEAVVGRGGILRPLKSGVYQVNDLMKDDLTNGTFGIHASNLGGLLADELGRKYNCPAFIADPVSVDEYNPWARVSGIPQIVNMSMGHALNIKAICHQYEAEYGVNLDEINLIVAHLGSGISVAPIDHGKITDYNNANYMGPFSPERAGGVPVGNLCDLCFSGEFKSAEDLKNLLNRESGLKGYLGSNDVRVISDRINNGDTYALEVIEAMFYQIAKEIGAMSTVLKGDVEAILLTGGMAHSERLVNYLKEHVSYIAPVIVYAGEDELRALAKSGQRVLNGEQTVQEYTD